MQVAADLAQPDHELAELARRSLELGREPRQRCQRPLGRGRERRRAVTVLGRDGGRRRSGALHQLGSVAHAVSLGSQCFLLAALEAVGALDELAQRFDPGRLGACVAGDLVGAPTCNGQLPPRVARLRRRTACCSPMKASSTSS